MTATSKISSCVDCATPIIGDRLRCPACRVHHEASKPLPVVSALAIWLGAVLLCIAAVVLLTFVARSCR